MLRYTDRHVADRIFGNRSRMSAFREMHTPPSLVVMTYPFCTAMCNFSRNFIALCDHKMSCEAFATGGACGAFLRDPFCDTPAAEQMAARKAPDVHAGLKVSAADGAAQVVVTACLDFLGVREPGAGGVECGDVRRCAGRYGRILKLPCHKVLQLLHLVRQDCRHVELERDFMAIYIGNHRQM